MFSSTERLKARTPKKSADRFTFLKQLVDEFQTTKSQDAKEQVLANLSNFAYDPINYPHLRSLHVLDLYLALITSPDFLLPGTGTLVHYALAGLCNLCLDKENKEYILSHGGVEPVTSLLLSSTHEETVLNAITTLMFLVTPQSKPDITRPDILVRLLQMSSPEPTNTRAHNLASIFLSDLCSEAQVEEARLLLATRQIPLPEASCSLQASEIPDLPHLSADKED